MALPFPYIAIEWEEKDIYYRGRARDGLSLREESQKKIIQPRDNMCPPAAVGRTLLGALGMRFVGAASAEKVTLRQRDRAR